MPNELYGFSFDIFSDYAHFRHVFTQSFFETLLAPSKTVATGLLAATLGLGEKEAIGLNDELSIGVEVLKIGGFASEITTALNLKSGSIERTPTLRNLLISPKYRLYVACKDKTLLDKLHKAVNEPAYPLYLGISECLAEVANISPPKKLRPVKETDFQCLVPSNGKEYNYKLTQPRLRVVLPRVFKTVSSYIYTPKGRKPLNYIDLIMFYNCMLKFKEPIKAFKFEGKNVCLF
ncbi:MAG: type I-E CRISPR-associated protein Cas5/CasD [Nitrososphaerales archaeon]